MNPSMDITVDNALQSEVRVLQVELRDTRRRVVELQDQLQATKGNPTLLDKIDKSVSTGPEFGIACRNMATKFREAAKELKMFIKELGMEAKTMSFILQGILGTFTVDNRQQLSIAERWLHLERKAAEVTLENNKLNATLRNMRSKTVSLDSRIRDQKRIISSLRKSELNLQEKVSQPSVAYFTDSSFKTNATLNEQAEHISFRDYKRSRSVTKYLSQNSPDPLIDISSVRPDPPSPDGTLPPSPKQRPISVPIQSPRVRKKKPIIHQPRTPPPSGESLFSGLQRAAMKTPYL